MRVVAGTAGGRPLRAPRRARTRPTSDRVREAMFSMLESLGGLTGASVLDLFAGSGALGIESLSRGAGRAVLVDHDPDALATIEENLAVLGDARSRAHVVRSDALRYLRAEPPPGRFDVVLADPPYDWSAWPELLDGLAARAGLLVAETAAPLAERAGWETVKVKRYGTTVVTIARPALAASNPPGPEGES